MITREYNAQFVVRLLANIEGLLSSAKTLFEQRNIAHGTHFAILCIEECGKCLMYILRDARPELFDKARYRHLPKYHLFGLMHFVAGALSMVYFVKKAKDYGLLGGTDEDFKIVLDDLLEVSGVADFDNLAVVAKNALDKLSSQMSQDSPLYQKMELYRKISVYCDLANDGDILDKEAIEEEFALDIIKDATFAVILLRMVHDRNFSLDKIALTWPSKMEDLEKLAEEMRQNVLAARTRIATGRSTKGLS